MEHMMPQDRSKDNKIQVAHVQMPGVEFITQNTVTPPRTNEWTALELIERGIDSGLSPEHTNKKECIAQMHDRWKRSGNEKKEINCTSHSNAQWVEIKELELHFTLHNSTPAQQHNSTIVLHNCTPTHQQTAHQHTTHYTQNTTQVHTSTLHTVQLCCTTAHNTQHTTHNNSTTAQLCCTTAHQRTAHPHGLVGEGLERVGTPTET